MMSNINKPAPIKKLKNQRSEIAKRNKKKTPWSFDMMTLVKKKEEKNEK